MYDYLKALWGLTDTNYNQYGRCYRQVGTNKDYEPKAFVGGNEYNLLTYNDRVIITSFFDVKETINVVKNVWNSANVDIHFMVNIAAIETLITGQKAIGRYDIEVQTALQYFIEYYGYNFHIKQIQQGAKKAWSEFKGIVKDNILIIDKQPIYIFRIDTELLNYNFYSTNLNKQ